MGVAGNGSTRTGVMVGSGSTGPLVWLAMLVQ